MRLMSHTHINGNGSQFRDEYARIIAKACKARKFTHTVIGCHGSYIASRQTMDEVRKLGIVPIRYTELGLANIEYHKKSHVAFINIPEEPLPNYKDNLSNINVFDEYIKRTGCKLVLCHPRDLTEIKAWAPYIHGYEIVNGEDCTRSFTNRNAAQYFPHLKQFCGADYHVWKGKGDPNLFTDLPDNWFGGKIYK